MMNILSTLFSISFVFSIFRMTTPLLYGSISSLFAEECGISNIGIEGIMLLSAIISVITSSMFGGSALAGLLVSLVFGALAGFLLGYLVMKLKCDPIIAGISYNLFAAGVSIFLLFLATGEKGNSASLISGTIPNINIPLVKDIPFVGALLSGHNLFTYLILLLLPAVSYIFSDTVWGLHIRSAGEAPEALESVGINVRRVRYSALIASGIFAAAGGAYMSMGYVSLFVGDMVAGRGFIAIAATALGNGKVKNIFLACVLFGIADAVAINPDMQNFIGLPSEMIGTIPYVVTIVALVIYSNRAKSRRMLLKSH